MVIEAGSKRGGPRSVAQWESDHEYRYISLRRATPNVGAFIDDIDVSRLDEPTFNEVRRALAEHCVLFFRNQDISTEDHIAFGRRFGDLDVHPAAANATGHPEILVIAADEHSSRANGEAWHSDVSCQTEPPMASILHMHETPPSGGDTMFSSMYAAYEALSPRMQSYLEGLTALHDGEHVYRGLYDNVADKPKYPRAEHPIVRTHPESGRKCLFVNRSFTTKIVGLPIDEGNAILQYLYAHMEHPNFQVRFNWEPRSIAMWDNRCAQHRAIWDYWPHRRYGHRVTVKGDRPF